MLIGQFCETYPPTMDGVGRVMYSYCKHLAACGHRALYIAPDNRKFSPPEDCETLLYGGVSVPGEVYRAGFPRLSKSYRRAINGLQFDLLHAHSPFFAAREARRLAKRCGAPLVATFHSKYYDDFLKATHSRLLAKAVVKYIVNFYNTCDEVWTVSNKSADVLREYGYRGEIVVMYNGTNPFTLTADERAEALQATPIEDGKMILLYVGQLNLKKNIESILKACGCLRDKQFPFQCVLVGAGPDEDKIRALTQKLGLQEHVLFTGPIGERSRLMALYERADLLVFPSLYDTFGIVVREAAVMGTPALLIADSCVAEGIIGDENGFLCENDAVKIAECILRASGKTRSVGAKAKETIPIAWENIITQVEDRYRRLIQKKAERGGE